MTISDAKQKRQETSPQPVGRLGRRPPLKNSSKGMQATGAGHAKLRRILDLSSPTR